MKRSWIFTILACAVIIGCGIYVAVVQRASVVAGFGAVYDKYADKEGVEALRIKDYKVNDTVAVDVTVLKATNDSAWALLQSDFGIAKLPPSLLGLISKGEDIVGTSKARGHMKGDTTLFHNEVLVFSYLNKTIYVFHTDNESQGEAVLYHNIDKQLNKEPIVSQKDKH